MDVNDRNGIGLPASPCGVLADVITQSNIVQHNVAEPIDQSILRRGGIKLTNAMNYLNITCLASRARQISRRRSLRLMQTNQEVLGIIIEISPEMCRKCCILEAAHNRYVHRRRRKPQPLVYHDNLG